jgi:hypothetical protein
MDGGRLLNQLFDVYEFLLDHLRARSAVEKTWVFDEEGE